MHTANLTRLGPLTISGASEPTLERRFKASPGKGAISLSQQGISGVEITLNGALIEAPNGPTSELEIPLQADNHIVITHRNDLSAELELRVTQTAEADLRVQRQGYFGLNTTDIERQRQLYETLGFIGEIYPAGPETSETFARSLGFEDNYLIHVSLHSLENPPTPPFVDTVQFREQYYRGEPPYARLNHLGMAYATYTTTNLDGDVEYLTSKGVEFLSAPATAPNGERFVFMKDQDGAFLKLVHTSGDSTAPGPNLVRLENTNMNVVDLQRTKAFYQLLGFTEATSGTQAGGGDFAQAHGFDHEIEYEECNMSFGTGAERATLQLRQWKTPFDSEPPYAPPVNHLGIDRINFYVDDLTPVIKQMTELGFERLGPIGGSVEMGIVFFFDPDGIKVQFAGPQLDKLSEKN